MLHHHTSPAQLESVPPYPHQNAGNLLGLFVSPLILASHGWRALFSLFGALGAPLLALWLAVVPDRPPQAAAAAAAAAAPAAASDASSSGRAAAGGAAGKGKGAGSEVGVLDLMSKAATWAIIVVNIVNHWGYFIYLNW